MRRFLSNSSWTPLNRVLDTKRRCFTSSVAGFTSSQNHRRNSIALRREDKNRWERRVALTPTHVKKLIEEHGATIYVQPSNNRVFPDKLYEKVRFVLILWL